MIFIIIISILSLDQLSKFLLNKSLSLNQTVPVIKGIFHLTLVHNRGAAFGLFKGQVPLFIFISLFAITLIYLALKGNQAKRSTVYQAGLGLILAGAAGNLIDRLFFGYVIDFLDFRIWPVFNIADSAITVGAILLGVFILKNASDNL